MVKADDKIFRKVIWPGRRERFDIDFFEALLPKRKVSSDPRYASGTVPSEKCGRIIQYESGLELDFIRFLERSPRVVFYFEQPVKIPYRRGKKRLFYTPDFGVYLSTGEFVLVEIKDLHAMLEDRVQVKMEGLVEFCSRRGFGLLLTDGRHTIGDIKKIKLNRTLEKDILHELEENPIRRQRYADMLKKSGATHNDLLRIILKHDLYYSAFPYFKLKHGGFNPLFREVFVGGRKKISR